MPAPCGPGIFCASQKTMSIAAPKASAKVIKKNGPRHPKPASVLNASRIFVSSRFLTTRQFTSAEDGDFKLALPGVESELCLDASVKERERWGNLKVLPFDDKQGAARLKANSVPNLG